jgi:glutamate 5-kinase
VRVVDSGGRELARGLSAYSSDDARRILGRRSSELPGLLGYRGRDELVHRDDLVVTRRAGAVEAGE